MLCNLQALQRRLGRPHGRPEYVDEAHCVTCHPDESELWRGSHHDLAMQPATSETVLGDFGDATFQDGDLDYRFFRRDGRFFFQLDSALLPRSIQSRPRSGPVGSVAP